MNGASGSFYTSGSNYNTGEVRLTVYWKQTYTPGADYSTVSISAEMQRRWDTDYSLGGTWYAWSTGGVSVNGTRVCTWYDRATTIGCTNPGQVGWSGSGSVNISHSAAKDITISVDQVRVNNTTYSASSFTIKEASKTVTLDPIMLPYSLTITEGENSWVSVNRTSSPAGLATGVLTNGSLIAANDILDITAGASENYVLKSLTYNGSDISSGTTKTVAGDVTIVSRAEEIANGTVYIYTGSSWQKYQTYVHDGTGWAKAIPYVHTGSAWTKIS